MHVLYIFCFGAETFINHANTSPVLRVKLRNAWPLMKSLFSLLLGGTLGL
jgi:hypothetical protein